MPLELVKLDASDPAVATLVAERDTYVFQEPAWLEALATLGHKVGYWALTDGGRPVLVQPTVVLRLAFFRLLYFGLPYGAAVGELDRYEAFLRLAATAARAEGLHRIRVSRNHYDPDVPLPPGREQVHVQQVLHFDGRGEEEVFADFKGRVRRDVRLAARRGVTVGTAETPALRDALFAMYRRTMARNETFTVWTRAMIERIWETIVRPGRGEMLVALHEDEPLSGLAALYSGDRCFYFLGASSGTKRNLCPNDAVVWEVMRRALARGCADFDFMMSAHDDRSLIDFKAKWGPATYPFVFREIDLKPLPCRAWDAAYALAQTKWAGRLIRCLKRGED